MPLAHQKLRNAHAHSHTNGTNFTNFDVWTKGACDQSANILIGGQSALPPEPQPYLSQHVVLLWSI